MPISVETDENSELNVILKIDVISVDDVMLSCLVVLRSPMVVEDSVN